MFPWVGAFSAVHWISEEDISVETLRAQSVLTVTSRLRVTPLCVSLAGTPRAAFYHISWFAAEWSHALVWSTWCGYSSIGWSLRRRAHNNCYMKHWLLTCKLWILFLTLASGPCVTPFWVRTTSQCAMSVQPVPCLASKHNAPSILEIAALGWTVSWNTRVATRLDYISE